MLKRIFSFCLFLMVACVAMAQVTTSSVAGHVTDAEGPMTGVLVLFVHTPTQTQYSTMTDHTGSYHLDGMRVGGPYEAEFSFVGYESVRYNGIMLELGEQCVVNARFDKSHTNIESVVVTAEDRYDVSHKGSGSTFTSETMSALPSVSRSIYDFTRLSPYAMSLSGGGMSISGVSGRYNSFQIDGAVCNDIYGLTSGGTNGGLTEANPIPLDALEAVQISVAPFDVRQNGFTGGGINAVTKSGTNQFSGTAYAYYNNQDFYGKGPAGVKLSKQTTQIYGASIGGAIIKDKLFFFVNGEYNDERSPSSYYIGYNGCKITEQDAITIANRYKELTGYDGGGYGKRDVARRSGSLMARLDWNINSRHNLTLRYNFLDGYKDEYSNTAATFLFNGAGYASVSMSHSIVGELNSRVSQKIFNKLLVGYTRVYDGRSADVQLPFVQITKMRDGENTSVSIGTDAFAGANALTQNAVTITDNLSIYAGNHTVTVGTHNEIFVADNLYVANILGTYTYNTLEDFLKDNARKYVRNYPIGDATLRFSTAQFGFYAQDEWRVDKFSLTYGLRADIPVVFGAPKVNDAFNGSDIATKYGVATGVKPRANVLLSPRVGFRWEPIEREDYSLVVRGGVGLFSGKIPFVWVNNCYSNTGMTMLGYTLDRNKGQKVPAFGEEPVGTEGVSSNPAIYVVDAKFRYPQVLRANLALEQNIKGWNLLVEGIFSKSYNNIFIYNLVAQRNGVSLYAVDAEMANERNTTPLYETSRAKQYSSVYYLTNTNKGYSYSLCASLSKHFPFGLSLLAAYTFGHSYSVNDGVSSQASSIWGKNWGVISDKQHLSFSIFDTPHKVSASLSYTKRYGGSFGTTVSLIYQGYSGMRYSLTYGSSADVNGDGYYGNSTIYIPTVDELQRMHFETEAQRKEFGDFIESNRMLRNHRGEYSQRNAMQTPFEHHLDLHFAQDFYFGAKSSRKVQLTLDVMNLGNLLCRDWGASYYMYNWKLSPVEIYDFVVDDAGNKTPKYRYVGGSLSKDDLLSRWRMQIGVRVVF